MLKGRSKLPVSPIACSRRYFVNKTFIFHAQNALIILHVEVRDYLPRLLSVCTSEVSRRGLDEFKMAAAFGFLSQGITSSLFRFPAKCLS